MMMTFVNHRRLIVAIAAVLSVIAIGSITLDNAKASNSKSWYWEVTSPVYRVWWNSSIGDNQTTYSQFPSDLRQDFRNSAFQWDDYNVPDSILNFDETWGSTYDLTLGVKDFSDEGWDDIPGQDAKTLSGFNIVTDGEGWLNSDWSWTDETMNQSAKKADVLTVMIHEIGHPTGLSHPTSGCSSVSVMCPDYRILRALTSHDKNHMKDKY